MPNPVVVNDDLQQQVSELVTVLLARAEPRLDGLLNVTFDPTSGETFHVRTVGENYEITWGVFPQNKDKFKQELAACVEAFKEFFADRERFRLRRLEERQSSLRTAQRILTKLIEDGTLTLNDTLEEVMRKLEG